MSKQRELLGFRWQKNQNEFIFAVTLLLALFAVREEFVGGYKLMIYILFPILIFLAGWGLIRVSLAEKEYLDELADKRLRVGTWSKVKSWLLIGLSFVIGGSIVVVAMNIWKELFSLAFG